MPQTDILLTLLFFNVGVAVGKLSFATSVLEGAWIYRHSVDPAPL